MRRRSGREWLIGSVVAAGAWGASLLLDRAVHGAVTVGKGIEGDDWYQALRQVGWLPTWIFVGVVVLLVDLQASRQGSSLHGAGRRPWRGPLIMASAALAGLAAAILKPLLGRTRPDAEGVTRWVGPLGELLEGESFGLPSGHAATAFGGAIMVGLLWPTARWPMVALAAGCGLSRMLVGAHAFSDVVLSLALATAIAVGLRKMFV